jgi:dTDP-4-dehydrorhamnose reductase
VRTHGGNRQTRYADVEAVRVSADGVIGPGPLLQEAWERYRRPVAVTEAHIGCTREEQLRWLRDVWRAAHEARDAGANVVAVTAWALLGTHNWHNLVTHDEGHYEPGAFDTRTEPPRATALADAIRELAAGRRRPSHPAVAGRGWWARPDRLTYPPARGDGPARAEARAIDTPRTPRRTIALLTRHGAMRDMVLSACARRGLRVVRLRVPGASTDDAVQRLRAALTNARAWAVIDLPAPTAARRSRRASAIERAAAEQGIPLLRLAERTRRRSGAGVLHVAAHDPAFAPERLVDDALDLLIDGATGWWTCNAQGAHPTTARTVATRRP